MFTLPAPIADIACQTPVQGLAQTMLTIAADPKHPGAKIGISTVLHTWGSALTHHLHLHMIVPGGGIALDGKRWVACRPGWRSPCACFVASGR